MYKCKMQGRNLDWTGVQSYVIIKLAYAFSYQEKNLRKNSDPGQLEIWEPWLAVNLTQSVNIHGYILSPAKTER